MALNIDDIGKEADALIASLRERNFNNAEAASILNMAIRMNDLWLTMEYMKTQFGLPEPLCQHVVKTN